MKRLLVLLFACAACRHESAEMPILTPHGELLDDESERLYASCEVRAIVRLPRDEIDARAKTESASFVEIVHEPDRGNLGVVMFRCPSDVPLPHGS
jgi:hypothetical protein